MTEPLNTNKSIFSKRENDVLMLLVQGMTNKQIALQLGISEKTVEKHTGNIYQKIDVHSRTETIIWAMNSESNGRDFPHRGIGGDNPHRKQQKPPIEWQKFLFLKRRMPMKRKDWFVSIIAGLLLGMVAIGLGLPRLLTESPAARASSQVDDVLSLILNSHSKWMTVQGKAEITWYGEKEEVQSYTNRFAIYQPLSAYVDVINKDGSGFNEGVWISDGVNVYNFDKETKSYTEGQIPNFANDLSVLPKDLSQARTDVVYNHPFSLIIPAPVKEYIYPEWFAQGNPATAYSLLGEDSLLGRKTWIVQLDYKTGQATAWVDQTTGMILRYVQEENGQKYVEFNFTLLEVDMPLDANTFAVPSDYQSVEQE